MNIVPHLHHSSEILSTKTSHFLEEFHVGKILKSCNAYKVRGFSVKDVFQVAFENAFSSKSFFQKEKEASASIPFAKDTFYRFMNSHSINWRRFTLQLASAVIQKIAPLTAEDRRNVLIVDDSLFSRARSTKVELLARVFDHAEGKHTKGFRMLTLGWSDGNSFLPLNHCLLSSTKRRNRIQEASRDVDARSNGGKQRKLAQTKAPTVVQELLKEAKAAEIPARYVLFDTWFCSPASMIQIKELGYDVVAMLKRTEKIHFQYQGRGQSAPAIFRAAKKRRGRSAYLFSVEVEARKDEKTIPVKLVFVRNRNKPQDYLILASTDVTLSEEEIIQTYGKRWNIEVFFKMCKTFLKLGKESRSISYDALTAHVSIVFARYMMLSLEQRRNVDKRSIGELFFLAYDELQDLRYIDALHLILKMLVDVIKQRTIFMEKELDDMLNSFLENLPILWHKCLKQCT
ncbi:transposase [uncultured Mitsuokella sp.]|uniref:IS4 family transposase n=1 Tax=uncultured Mitsuokella sp. TaxID=453120 RepID=UPI00267054A7|nr:transposase [uncultured Mitsuokella sp.]